jgi:hypothetical protein
MCEITHLRIPTFMVVNSDVQERESAKRPLMNYIPFEHVRLENVTNFQFPIGTSTGSTGNIELLFRCFQCHWNL